MGRYSKIRRIVRSVKDKRPPGLEAISRRIHASNDAGSQCRRFGPHRVISPRKKCRLDAVDRAGPVVRSELGSYCRRLDKYHDCVRNTNDANIVSGHPAVTPYIGPNSPDKCAGDSDSLYSRWPAVHFENTVLSLWMCLHVQVQELLVSLRFRAITQYP